MSKKKTTYQFIIEAQEIHKGRYDYSLTKYDGNKTKVEIICAEHGSFFQAPSSHLKGKGCKKCGEIKSANDKIKYDKYILDNNEVHGTTYDYSKSKFTKVSDVMTITCRTHGDFKQSFKQHILMKQGCPICSGNTRITNDEFIRKAKIIHKDLYDYSKTNYISNKHEVTIICKEHGDFQQIASNHLRGKICNKCSGHNVSQEDWLKTSRHTHNDKYDYSKVKYEYANDKVIITCPIHGDFKQGACVHKRGQGCPTCGNRISKAENEIIEYLTALNIDVVQSDRSIITPLELDIVIPNLKIAIEYNGLHWHSEEYGKDKNYHKNKTDLCAAVGYRLVHIFEDDYLRDKDKVLSFLKHLVGKATAKRVYARNCTIKEIGHTTSSTFLAKYHIQGGVRATRHFGMFFEDGLVAVTSFKKASSNTKNSGSYELVRHATNGNVIGSLGKVTSFFSKTVSDKIYTFCDNSYFNGSSYLKAGFVKTGEIKPDYMYIADNKREHKFNWRNAKRVSLYPETLGMSETDGMNYIGIYRIWDCGKTRYEWKRK